MQEEPIVISGIGLLTPLGLNKDETWSKIKEGESLIDLLPSSSLPQDLSPYVRYSSLQSTNSRHRIFDIAFTSVNEAILDARINLKSFGLERVGCSVSVSKPVLNFPLLPLPSESVNQYVREQFGFCGPSQNIIAACATGIHSILTGLQWLKEEQCDMVVAGSVESSLDPIYVAGFKNMGVLSKFPRPFDRRRNGFILSEGAGILVLERKKDALRRGARIYSEILSGAVGSDSHHPTAFNSDGSSIAGVIQMALERCDRSVEAVQYINCHGTGTKNNDFLETRAIKRVFGKWAENISLSSTKGATGHLLGASGSVEAAITALSIHDSFVPPTLHLEEKDPDCDLDYTPLRGKTKKVDAALSLSFGFGGPIGALLLGRG